MDTALPQKFPFILDRNLAKANCTTGNRVCTSCDTVVLAMYLFTIVLPQKCLYAASCPQRAPGPVLRGDRQPGRRDQPQDTAGRE